MALAGVLVLGPNPASAAPSPDDAPSRADVEQAREAARSKAGEVAAVRAALAVANQRLDDATVEAARAAETYNGTLWRSRQARRQAKQARLAARSAARDVQRQRAAYGETLVRSYESASQVSGLASMLESDGISTFVERSNTAATAATAMDERYDRFRAAATVSEVAHDRADAARAEAEQLAAEAREAARTAQQSADAALAAAAETAAEKDRLIAELATLQGISVQLAAERQRALEEESARRVAEQREREQREREEREQEERERDSAPPVPSPDPSDPTPDPTRSPEPRPTPTPSPTPTPTPTPKPEPSPEPKPTPPPAPKPPASGARAAVAFAAAQIGDPYRWGASGPNAWDCSGLTAGAWAAGGKSLPHYSVAQYTSSTPIRASQLRPGDLVFWGSGSSPSSIFHVALYAGDGQIIHAPRTGRPVTRESMYYWRAPNFFARP